MDIHFNGYKVRYVQLNQFFKPIRSTHNIRSINIYINLDDFFHTMHKPLINNQFQICSNDASKQFISNIFNLIGHYRNWALKERLSVKVFGIYTSASRAFKNNIHVHEYRKKFIEHNNPSNASYYFINQAIHAALPVMATISNYVPDVYLIDSKYLEPSIVPLYIDKELYHADWNLLISRDTYDLQYAYKDKWSLIVPKGDNSRIVTGRDIWNYVSIKEHVYKEPVDMAYDCSLYILAKSIVGDQYRNIPRLRRIGWKTLFKYLDDTIAKNKDCSIVRMQNYLVELLEDKRVGFDDINSNIACTNVEEQVNAMMEIDKTVIDSQFIDIPDYENLKEMNRTKFYKYPINLDFLCNELVKKTPF